MKLEEVRLFWGCFAASGVESVQDRIKSQNYQGFLEQHVSSNRIKTQNTRMIQSLTLDPEGLLSPDLNAVEHLWKELKRANAGLQGWPQKLRLVSSNCCILWFCCFKLFQWPLWVFPTWNESAPLNSSASVSFSIYSAVTAEARPGNVQVLARFCFHFGKRPD